MQTNVFFFCSYSAFYGLKKCRAFNANFKQSLNYQFLDGNILLWGQNSIFFLEIPPLFLIFADSRLNFCGSRSENTRTEPRKAVFKIYNYFHLFRISPPQYFHIRVSNFKNQRSEDKRFYPQRENIFSKMSTEAEKCQMLNIRISLNREPSN